MNAPQSPISKHGFHFSVSIEVKLDLSLSAVWHEYWTNNMFVFHLQLKRTGVIEHLLNILCCFVGGSHPDEWE